MSLAFIFPWEELSLEQSSQGGPAAYSSGAALHNFSGNLIPHSPPQFCTGRAQSTGANIPIFHHFNDFFFFEHRKEENITLTPKCLQAREVLDATDISQCCSQPFFPAPSSWFQSRSHVSAALWAPQEVLTHQVFSTSSNTKGQNRCFSGVLSPLFSSKLGLWKLQLSSQAGTVQVTFSASK